MQNAAGVVDVMLSALKVDIGECLKSRGYAVAVTGAVRGAVRGPEVAEVSEKSVLGTLPQEVHTNLAHEFARAVYRLCLTEDERREWQRVYDDVRHTDFFTYADFTSSPEDFFARFSVTYLEQPQSPQLWTGRRATKFRLSEIAPHVFAFLGRIYERYEGGPKVDAAPTVAGDSAAIATAAPAATPEPTATHTPTATPLPDGYEKEALIALYNSD